MNSLREAIEEKGAGKKAITTKTGLEDKCLTNTNFIGMDIIHEFSRSIV